MVILWRIVTSLIGEEAGLWRSHLGARSGLMLGLAVSGLLAGLLGLALAVVALSIYYGLLTALAICFGLALLACITILILLKLESRAHARAAARQAAERRRLIETALIAALPGMKAGSAIALGLVSLILMLVTGRHGKDEDEDDDQPTSPET